MVPMNRWLYSKATDQFGAKPTSTPVPNVPPQRVSLVVESTVSPAISARVLVVGDRRAALYVP